VEARRTIAAKRRASRLVGCDTWSMGFPPERHDRSVGAVDQLPRR
jgi:hypothetical protein